jgi:hypothetical protein
MLFLAVLNFESTIWQIGEDPIIEETYSVFPLASPSLGFDLKNVGFKQDLHIWWPGEEILFLLPCHAEF